MSAVEEVVDRGDWFQTSTGRKVFIFDPKPADVDPEDIAHALSNLCRFGGHSKIFYSVAQHSVHVAGACEPKHELLGLLHDATESFLGDVIRPLKRGLPEYAALEKKWALAIGERFGLGDRLANLPPDVKLADMRLLVTEKRDVVGPGPGWDKVEPGYQPVEPLPVRIKAMTPDAAKAWFWKKLRGLVPREVLR